MRRAAAALIVFLALAGSAAAKVPTLTFKEARTTLDRFGVAQLQSGEVGAFQIWACRRTGPHAIWCGFDWVPVPNPGWDIFDTRLRVTASAQRLTVRDQNGRLLWRRVRY